jgi:hypothetical protein
MTLYYDEKTKKYGPAMSLSQIKEQCWAGVVACGGDEEKLKVYHKKCEEMKQQILDVMKKEGKTTIKEYMEVRKRLFFSGGDNE